MQYLERIFKLPGIYEATLEEITRRRYFKDVVKLKQEELEDLVFEETNKRRSYKNKYAEYVPMNSLFQYMTNYNIPITIEIDTPKEELHDIGNISNDDIQSLREKLEGGISNDKVATLESEIKGLRSLLDKKTNEHLETRKTITDQYERQVKDLNKHNKLVEDIFASKKLQISKALKKNRCSKCPLCIEGFTGELAESKDVVKSLKTSLEDHRNQIDV